MVGVALIVGCFLSAIPSYADVYDGIRLGRRSVQGLKRTVTVLSDLDQSFSFKNVQTYLDAREGLAELVAMGATLKDATEKSKQGQPDVFKKELKKKKKKKNQV
ncbi:hypothetical protein FB45DRAFT_435377 [Roridomyces roridus]|uniref:Uncharacterized protein n=1 Tax=Roridomyces roridus TaxID=1738132 RepID=A0AAD7F9B2_9AGAR|nr:hypothetical protein FB45DRAFT_435377 [Roridomyces roridus]